MAVLELNYKSEVLNCSTSLMVALPENSILMNHNLSTLYLFHGLGDDHTKWSRRTNIESYIKNLPLIVVMPNFEKSFYNDMYMGGDNYWTHFIEEIIPLINKLFRVKPGRENNFIAGNSMGGFGALKIYSNYPDLFNAVYSYSGIPYIKELFNKENYGVYKYLDAFKDKDAFDSIFRSTFGTNDYITNSENDLTYQIERSLGNNDLPDLYMYCGYEDPLIHMNRKFQNFLEDNDVEHHYIERNGSHDWFFWDGCLKDTIKNISHSL